MFQARLFSWMMVTLSVMTVLYLATSVSAGGCPSGFFYLPNAQSCYKLMAETQPWGYSSERCSYLSATSHLAVIDNSEEDTAVSDYLNSLDFNTEELQHCSYKERSVFYIAGQRKDPTDCQSAFVWKKEGSEAKEMEYTNWPSNEPDCVGSYGSKATCLVYDTTDNATHVWNDVACDMYQCSICEDNPLA